MINRITVDNFASLFNCTPVDRDRSSFVCCLVYRGSTGDILLLQISNGVVWQSRDFQLSRNTMYLLSPRFCFSIALNRDYFVYRDDPLTS